mgnify:CR=1 FL=1
MSTLYEIVIDGELRIVIYDYEHLAAKIYADIIYAVINENISLEQATDKIKLLCDGVPITTFIH